MKVALAGVSSATATLRASGVCQCVKPVFRYTYSVPGGALKTTLPPPAAVVRLGVPW